MDLLGKVQDNEPTAPVPRRRSALFSPAPSSARTSPSPPPTPIPSSPEITVLPSPLACVGFAKSAERACNERLRKYIVWPERSLSEWREQALEKDPSLHDDNADGSVSVSGRPFISYTRTEDGTSLVTEIKALRGMFPPGDMEELDVQCATELSFDEPEFDDHYDDDDDDDEEDRVLRDIQGEGFAPDPAVSTLTATLIEGDAPPTPPLETHSVTSSPEKKRFSLPLSLPPPATGQKGYHDIHVPISWSRPMMTTRSMSASARPHSISEAGLATSVSPLAPGASATGVKRCLQLDMRGVTDNEAYNLG